MKEVLLALLTPEIIIVFGTAFGGFVLSVSVSFWSEYVRHRGPKAAPWQLALTVALNTVAGNPHKARRAKRALDRVPKDE